MFDLFPVIAIAKSMTLVFGGLVTFLALRAYRRTGSPALRSLAIGLGLVTVGGLAAGLVHQGLGFELAVGVAVQSVFSAVGFAIIAYSLYSRSAPSRRPTDADVA